MTTSYRLLLLEDDLTLANALTQALDKQNLYSQRVEVHAVTYDQFARQFGTGRNSTRELILLGGKREIGYKPDIRLLKAMISQLERAHIFLLTPSSDAQEILSLWKPGVSGVLAREEQAADYLVKAIQRLQMVQQKRSYSRKSAPAPTSFWSRLLK
ncbi:hypothetical protein ACD591_15310 [Rufibacter glacialis]|uniref:Response regulator transcription factor n=1 Tax=Rufibacter glacialis TaxID=1259555 RepID=A0A5M8QRK6_9BACT|nr:hypothetical protein [Rufibacter glacialis]KAA6437680.1 hypothetical protein FOE74_04030 [Rufibacter glacialis]GGK57283.1 hypothetical protein GCM10011405_01700 [Rufibacter glacialis]